MKNSPLMQIAAFFLENPYTEIYLRQLAKELKLSPYSVKQNIDLLINENLVKEERRANLRYFKADINGLFFRHLKVAFNISAISKSGIMDFLKENIPNISSIALFGSIAKGEDDKKSDVDMLAIGKEKYLDLVKFEEKLGRRITLHIYSWSDWNKKAKQDSAFYYEIISYGIPLYGELPIMR